MDEVSTQQYYIATKSAPPDDRTRVLKYGKMFAVFDRYGDVEPTGLGEEGIFYDGTRYLSELALFIGYSRPLLLSSTIREDNCLFTADLTNVDTEQPDGTPVERGTILVTRSKFLYGSACHELLKISNYGLRPIRIPFAFKFNADYADIFEVRGIQRKARGERLPDEVQDQSATVSYRGLDGLVRRTVFWWSRLPQRITASDCRLEIALAPKQETTIEMTVSCLSRSSAPVTSAFSSALSAATREIHPSEDRCQIHSDNKQFNAWMRRSLSDIEMMIVGNPERGYPYAGVPWFSTVFGRDGIITALECLWANPALSKGVLEYLAETQAHEIIPESDAEPGKIIHETRRGEMAVLGEVPFARYYGSVDATPLFVLLAGAYYDRTADRATIESLWPNIEMALSWVDQYGDRDGDGFVEYSRYSANGLVQQGWKDSNDSVFHADGTLAPPPIALCEVQGYVYAAKRGAARLAAALGFYERAAELETQARELKERFDRAFWCEEIGTYAIALDGHKQPCRVRTSNAGHCLYTGIAHAKRAASLADSLLASDFFNGWGIRTVGSRESRYNPVSYHNGSVWPHDTAIIAAGLGKYGFTDLAARLWLGLQDVSVFVDLHRLPELFCGLDRRSGEGPTLYPVACAPQAWAAASIYLAIQAALGINVDAVRREVTLQNPCLPNALAYLHIHHLSVGSASVDLSFRHVDNATVVDIGSVSGDLNVIIPQGRAEHAIPARSK